MISSCKSALLFGALTAICWVTLVGAAAPQLRSVLSLKWTQSTPFPEPRSGYAAGVIDGELVIAGGTYWTGTPGHWTKKFYSASTDAFDPVSQRWEKLPDLPVPLGYPASAVVGGKLFVLGGYTGREINRKMFVLKKSGSEYSWSVLRAKSPDRIFASAVSWGEKIYLVGGTTRFEAYDQAGTCCTSKTATKTLLLFDTEHPARGWQELSPYPGSARWLPAVAIDSKSIWLFGGIFESDPKSSPTAFDGVLKYDLTQGRWNVMPHLPKRLAGIQPLCSLALGNNIFLFTGHKQVWQFDLRTHRYSETTPMPENVDVDGFFWLDQRIIGAGGESTPEGPRRRSPWTLIARLAVP